MVSTWSETAPSNSETARASRQQDRERIQKEKEEEEAAAKQRLAEEKERHGKESGARAADKQQGGKVDDHTSAGAARGISKKARDAERKDEETARKQREDEEAAAATVTRETGEEDDDMSIDPNLTKPEARSPAKKKKKRNKSRKKDKGKESATFAEAVIAPPSVIRQGRFSMGSPLSNPTQKLKMQTYDHTHKRYLWDMAILLTAEDKYAEFTHALRSLFSNGLKVDDKWVIEPVVVGKGQRITAAEDIPYNHTDMGINVRVPGGSQAFEKRRPWKKQGGDRGHRDEDEEELEDPIVKFTIAFSSDEEPEWIMERLGAEWGKLGGKKIWPKPLGAFSTCTPVVLYKLHNGGHKPTLMAELRGIFEKAMALVEGDEMMDYFEHTGKDIPQMGFRMNVPKIPGQDTSVFSGWSKSQQWRRKCIHVEVDKKDEKFIAFLVTAAKERNLIAPVWGSNVRITNMADEDTRHVDLASLASYVRQHINYHASMRSDGLTGIINLDKEVNFSAVSDALQVAGTMSLRYVLYRFIKLADSHSLFGEVHQETPISSVDVVIPNTPEAETLLLMMKKNIGAFLHFHLKELGLDGSFITDLLRASVDPSLLHEIPKCSWEEKGRILTTPTDEKEEKRRSMENAAWYKDDFAALTVGKGKKKGRKQDYANPEVMYDLDGAQSVNTIHNRPGQGYTGSPGAATLNLGGGSSNRNGEVNVEVADSDDMSAISNLSRAELIERVRLSQLSGKGKQGSQPNKNDDKSSSYDSDESSSASYSSSASSGEPVKKLKAADRG